ncbi:uncharacterized protein EI90DRAFT_3044721 [Cantharellus anzutake]|uniref:uncharacterized protein n=1 Tax=Cantharellus anzutake TaxID=1750568 RepID=UPI001908C5E4|nr:uncharacterized protein EI90DRAFT_3044721 [Cantharellus anzutake]KAF8337055.1 hypothetical protein EI90DRAFT_3044721 [Cantharellus anzutake]
MQLGSLANNRTATTRLLPFSQIVILNLFALSFMFWSRHIEHLAKKIPLIIVLQLTFLYSSFFPYVNVYDIEQIPRSGIHPNRTGHRDPGRRRTSSFRRI